MVIGKVDFLVVPISLTHENQNFSVENSHFQAYVRTNIQACYLPSKTSMPYSIFKHDLD